MSRSFSVPIEQNSWYELLLSADIGLLVLISIPCVTALRCGSAGLNMQISLSGSSLDHV